VGRIDEKDGPLARLGSGQARLQAFFLNASWAATSALAGIIPTFSGFMPSERKNWRTWVGFRTIPVRASIRAAASVTVAGGCCVNATSSIGRCRCSSLCGR